MSIVSRLYPLLFGRKQSGILSRAEGYARSSQYAGSGAWLDESGNGHDAQLGSTSGADTNDPKFLEHAGTQYAYLPGTDDNYFSAPDTAALGITGDLDVRARVAPDDWSPSGGSVQLVAKDDGTDREWGFQILSASGGLLRFSWWDSGDTRHDEDSTVAPTVDDGEELHVRATLDVDNGSSAYEVKFYTSSDGSTWDQLGTTKTGGATTSIRNQAAPLSLGMLGNGTSNDFVGRFFSAEVRDGIGGTVVADPDLTNTAAVTEPFATFDDAAGNTWTINRSSSGRKLAIVDRDLFLLGTDDEFRVTASSDFDFAQGEDLTVIVVARFYGTPGSSEWLIRSQTVGGAIAWGIQLSGTTPDFIVGDGTAAPSDAAGAATAGEVTGFAGRRDTTADEVEALVDGTGNGGTTDTTTGSTPSPATVYIGQRGNGSGYVAAEIIGWAIFREALTDAEIQEAGEALAA